MKREHKFETIEHTADVGVIGRGAEMAEAFENIAYGMISIIADPARYEPTEQTEVEASGDDEVTLLVNFLSSLLVVIDADNLLPLDFHITRIENNELTCRIDARPMRDDIEWLGPTIKAVTYHQAAVEQVEGEWRAKAIFDV